MYYSFVNPTTRWDSSKSNYELAAKHNTSDYKQTKEAMAEDLVAFLLTMSGFIEGGHLHLKIEKDTKCFNDVINMIRNYYDADITQKSDLDFILLGTACRVRPKSMLILYLYICTKISRPPIV